MTKILLTGGQGFLGGRALDFLVEAGFKVRALVRRPAPTLAVKGAEIILGDLSDADLVRRACQGVDGVIHCAAKSGVWGSLDSYVEANTLNTANLLLTAKACGVPWFIHTSTPSVVHTSAPLDGLDELTAPYGRNPAFAYPYSKMLAEKLVLAADMPGFRTVALRPHLIWGPGDPHFLPRLVARAQAGRLWLVRSDALVDATYIDNAAHAIMAATSKMLTGEGESIGGRAYFIAQGEPMTASSLITKMLAAVSPSGQKPFKVKGHLPAALSRVLASGLERIWSLLALKSEPPLTTFVVEELTLPHWFKLERAWRELGYVPQVSTAEGLERLKASTKVTPRRKKKRDKK